MTRSARSRVDFVAKPHDGVFRALIAAHIEPRARHLEALGFGTREPDLHLPLALDGRDVSLAALDGRDGSRLAGFFGREHAGAPARKGTGAHLPNLLSTGQARTRANILCRGF